MGSAGSRLTSHSLLTLRRSRESWMISDQMSTAGAESSPRYRSKIVWTGSPDLNTPVLNGSNSPTGP